MDRRIVTVFGGSGFLGRYVVKRLVKTGHIVRVAVRDPEDALFLKPMGEVGQVVPMAASVADEDSVKRAVDGAEWVVNLVGILSPWGKQSFDNIHHKGAGIVAKAAKEAGVERLVHVSALGADPESPSAYARTKAAGEQAVLEAFPAATIMQPSVVFGVEDGFFNKFAGIMRWTPALPVFGCPLIPNVRFNTEDDALIDIDLYGDGGSKFQPVYVADVAEAIVNALQDRATEGERYELCGPKIYSFKQIMELILKVTGRQRFLAPVPYGIAGFAAWFIEKLPKPMLTRDQLTLLKSDNIAHQGAQGLKELGVEPTPAEIILPTYLKRFVPQDHQTPRLA